jgi:AcrR family transcriptional regulator
MITILEKRGDSTRIALIQAGLELFGEYGFKGTTTRMLCDHAGANISAIPYYFGSKKGLYLAVMEHIVDRMQDRFGKVRESMARIFENNTPSRDEALQAIQRMMRTLAELFVESDEPKAWVQLIVREQARPTEAFDIIYQGQMVHIQRLMTSLIAICTGLDKDSDEVRLRNHALLGQALIFIVSRESLLRHLGVEKLQPGHIETIYKILMAHTEACLGIAAVSHDKVEIL